MTTASVHVHRERSESARFDGWSDQEVRYLVAMVDACCSEGIGRSGDDASDRALELEIAAEAVRRGFDKPYWAEH